MKKYTLDELEGMEIDELDQLAFGVQDDSIIELDPDQINIQYTDLENPEALYKKYGMKWVRSVDFSEPVDVSVKEDGKFYLEDGHHRYFAAKKLGRKLMCKIEVKGSPVRAILKRQGDL
jgi:ParB-like chromosome segregation protein Spo0J